MFYERITDVLSLSMRLTICFARCFYRRPVPFRTAGNSLSKACVLYHILAQKSSKDLCCVHSGSFSNALIRIKLHITLFTNRPVFYFFAPVKEATRRFPACRFVRFLQFAAATVTDYRFVFPFYMTVWTDLHDTPCMMSLETSIILFLSSTIFPLNYELSSTALTILIA